MQAGDLQTALAEIDLALGYLPENVELLTIKSILMESTGQADQAAEILDKARQLAPDSLNILLAQAQTYVLLQDPDGIRATGETLISRYPESAYGPMFVGSADELEGNYDAAVSQLNTAVELAESAGDINLSGNLRVRIGMLMQKSLAPELPQPTPAP
jgi:tetratricopeptide (TPR) repeat protein